MTHHDLILPDLGIEGHPITVSLWLVKQGSRVAAGEPIVEVLAGPATVDLPSPADGVLAEILVDEDETLSIGQRLGVIRS